MIDILTEDEKLTLGMLLREKIVETHDVEIIIKNQIRSSKLESSEIVLRETLRNVISVRDDCYSIALKLNIK